ncbi:fasciclin domain-containing protein [Novosphingopyxis sp.]|uniref:fasciclin domain-containing protein n=1 Tax=Novosphingopyxis sp. TaxID=2709690 RepID=UPI003B5BA223
MKPISLRAGLLALAVAAALPAAVYAGNIVQTAKADGHFTMLLKAGKAARAAPWLETPGPITVFAPNDAAFAKVPKGMLDDLMKPANRTKLKITVGNHAVAGLVTTKDIDKGLTKAPAVAVPAMNGMPLVIKREGGQLTVNGAHVIKGPMKVDNGLIYVIDAVLVPPMPIQPRL